MYVQYRLSTRRDGSLSTSGRFTSLVPLVISYPHPIRTKKGSHQPRSHMYVRTYSAYVRMGLYIPYVVRVSNVGDGHLRACTQRMMHETSTTQLTGTLTHSLTDGAGTKQGKDEGIVRKEGGEENSAPRRHARDDWAVRWVIGAGLSSWISSHLCMYECPRAVTFGIIIRL
jgi:hypothetical protein